MDMKTRIGAVVLQLWAVILIFMINQAYAGGPIRIEPGPITVPIFKSTNLNLNRAAQRVSVGNPDIADILILRSKELYIVGKMLGTTNVLVWDEEDKLVDIFDLEVIHDLNTLRKKLKQYLPNEPIGVHSSQGQLVVSGQSSSLSKMKTAVELAQGFADAANVEGSNSKVFNMVSIGGGQQIMLEVVVAEVSSEIARSFDSNVLLSFNGSDGFGGIVNGNDFLNSMSAVDAPAISSGFFGSYLSGDMLFNFALDVAKQHGLAKILAEPNITALSGQNAEFLSGGEYPVPVPSREGTTIEYRDFGVGVSFVPTILDSGKINLNLKVMVSEISNQNSVGITPIGSTSSLVVPSLVKRTSETTVELGDGQTIAIGGLLSDSLRETIDKIPGLGDLPILGQLFRSQQFVSGQSELVIMVTPRLVRPFNKNGVPLPTDGFVPVSDLEFYLLGKMTEQQGYAGSSSPNIRSSDLVLPDDDSRAQKYGHHLSPADE